MAELPKEWNNPTHQNDTNSPHKSDQESWNSGTSDKFTAPEDHGDFLALKSDPAGAKIWEILNNPTGGKAPGYVHIITELLKAILARSPQMTLTELGSYADVCGKIADDILKNYAKYDVSAVVPK